MELQQVLLNRRSIRKFTEETVSDEHINTLLHAAMSGPSAVNAKPWEFYVVTNPDTLAKLRSAGQYTNMNAPLALVVCGNMLHALPLRAQEFWIQDTSAATENILLCATDLGLGAVWCGIHPSKERKENVKKALGLPAHIVPLNIIYIGHPAQNPDPRDQYEESKIHFVK